MADYLKTVDLLIINYDSDKTILKKQAADLTQKNKDELYIIRAKLAEKEKEIEAFAKEAEKARVALLDSVEDRQKQWEDKMAARIAKQDRLYEEVMRLSEPHLKQIKDNKKGRRK